MKRAAILAVLVSAVLAGTPLPAKAPLHVDDDGAQWPGAYLDIETALADAVVGDTILVHEGVYPGAINVLTDRVALRADGSAVLDADSFPPPPWGDAGIVLRAGVSGVTIQGLEIRSFGAGIVVVDDAHDNVVKSNTVSGSAGVGIVLGMATANSIVGNEVIRSGFGIVVAEDCHDNVVKSNTVSDSASVGIVVDTATANSIVGNEVTRSGAGGLVLVNASAGNEVVGNVVTASGGNGITLTNLATNNVVKDNQVTASGLIHWQWKDGIRIAGDENEIKDNDVSDSREDGIGIRGDRNLVADNRVLSSGRYGISMLYSITNDNMARDNSVSGSLVFDLCDDGLGIGNVWRDNRYDTSNF